MANDTQFHKGDKVTVREDLVIGKTYNMINGPGDSFVTGMEGLVGKVCTIACVTEAGKYRLVEPSCSYRNYNWTDEMFKETVELPDLSESEDLRTLYDFAPLM